MSAVQTLGFLLGTSFASGLNLYATVAALGLLHRFHVIDLPPSLQVLSHSVVLAIVVSLYAVEFVADKIPFVDSVWDAIHTFIRPPAAAILAYSAVGQMPEGWRLAAALLAGSVALTSHGTKASARVAVNASPEPFSNSAASLAEDGIAVALTWLAGAHPILTIALVVALLGGSVWLLYKLFHFLKSSLRRLFAHRAAA
jgi:hypothetical protein